MKHTIYFFLILFVGFIAFLICALLLYFICCLLFYNNNNDIQIIQSTDNAIN